jgi:hypothetical protein
MITTETIHDPAFGPVGATLVHFDLETPRILAQLERECAPARTVTIREPRQCYLVPTWPTGRAAKIGRG